MNDHDIEKLMAYADGELDPASALEVERLLRDDEEARAIVERFRQTRSALGPDMDALLNEPVPQHLIDAIRAHPLKPMPALAQAATPAASAVTRQAANDRAYWPSLATAASLALVVGLFAGQWWGSQSGGGESSVAQALQRAMETLPAGEVLKVAGLQITPVTSYRGAEGQVCREFEQTADGRLAHGIACRTDTQWVTRLMFDHGPANNTTGSGAGFVPASGELDAISSLLDNLKLGPALSADEERAAIQQGWKTGR
jgi:negative regulator of sigma E activity